MVMTVLEAEVAPDRVEELERIYRETASELPPGIVETFLVRNSRAPLVFRIVTVWASWAALNAVRTSGETPRGVQMFQAVGAGPDLSVFDVVTHQRGE
jgi:heme-degrading monooxygenase HmoA